MRVLTVVDPRRTALLPSDDTGATFLGKLGDFGQPVIRKAAGGILDGFGRNLRAVWRANRPPAAEPAMPQTKRLHPAPTYARLAR